MSEFKVEVVRLGPITKHPNADRLEITNIHGGYPVIMGKGDFKEGDFAIYVPVDALVPASNPAFTFLVPVPMRKENMSDLEWADRLRRYEVEKTELVRVRAKKLRGTFSMGLLVPISALPSPTKSPYVEGEDVQAFLGIEKYEPDDANRRGHPGGAGGPGPVEIFPPIPVPVYTDIEGIRRWGQVLVEGEEVVITEKIHGQNARFVSLVKSIGFLDAEQELWVGSHYKFNRPPHKVTTEEVRAHEKADLIWRVKHVLFSALRAFVGFFIAVGVFKIDMWEKLPREEKRPRWPMDVKTTNWWDVALREKLAQVLSMIPNEVVYGEIYGPCQDLKYGTPEQLKFRAFDAYDLTTGRYLDYDDFVRKMSLLGIDTVPVLYRGPWSEKLRELAEGTTTLGGGHIREGIVIRPTRERTHVGLGRVILKLVGQGYLLRK